MSAFISFIKSHPVLCAIFAVLLVCVAVMGILIGIELSAAAPPPDAPTADTSSVSSDAVTDVPTEPQTEAVTEPPVPYYGEADDAAYHPSAHAFEEYDAVYLYSENHRIYTAYPETDSPAFNDYCLTTVTSLITASETPGTARAGGTSVVTVDYILYCTDNVYSAVFSRDAADTETQKVTRSVTVLIYNIETESVYAPLDRYDMTLAAAPLAEQIRAGYTLSFRANGLEADGEFLDAVCTPDPSSFVNIAVDEQNMLFFAIYDKSEVPVLLRAAVPFADFTAYTWAAIEAEKQAAQLPEQTPDEVVTPVVIPTYDLSGAVPESEMVGDDYFDDALFIGNSLIVGLQRTVPLNARYFASIGLNVSQVFTKELIPMKSGKVMTISDAMETISFSKVYLMFGINELGWGSIASFINYYGQIIDRIREINPDAIIYVQSILPINEEKWAKSRDFQSCINNVAVATFNQKIVEMCDDKGAAFVNVGEVLTDETGNLFSDATSDGIHIGGIFSTRWVEYLKTHTVTVS